MAGAAGHSVPDTDLTLFTLVPANVKQQEAHARAGAVHWIRTKSWEQYWSEYLEERREEKWALDGRLITWVLVRRDDLEGEVYAGCETYRRDAFIGPKGSPLGTAKDTTMYAIASVVTPRQHLRRGYATHMLRLLHYRIGNPQHLPPFPAAWGAPPPSLPAEMAKQVLPGDASILWSDVGSKFYSKCTIGETRPGWVVRDELVTELVWDLIQPDQSVLTEYEHGAVAWINDKIDAISATDGTAENEVGHGDRSKTTRLGYDPASPGILEFVNGKSRYFHGTGAAPEGEHGWITHYDSPHSPNTPVLVQFAHNPTIGDRLLIPYYSDAANETNSLDRVLKILDHVGASTGKKQGWIWGLDLNGSLVKEWKSLPNRNVRAGRRAEKDGHLLGLAYYGPEGEDWTLVNSQMWLWC